jgi:hypothetical protein
MNVAGRLGAFALVCALVFAGAAFAGSRLDPHPGRASTKPSMHAMAAMAPQPVRGLAVSEKGLTLQLARRTAPQGRPFALAFRIADRRGRTVRDFDVEHTKRMHFIVVRRDLTGFQHLHPTQAADGSWTAPVTIPDAGSYRVFADFTRAGDAHTLASDLRVDGPAELAPLADPATTAVSDGGYDVRLAAGAARAGQEARLRFTITRDRAPVRTEPYLGAGGHLVVLREGDLAFLHVHPSGDAVEFAATFPSPGRYRLFLQFKHEGRVQTVAFTQAVGR